MTEHDRRPIAARDSGWARSTAAMLARRSITPNQISVASMLFAACGATLLWACRGSAGLLLCALCILLRLLCNLFDGMVAIEGGKQTPAGPLYNEVPDRVTDSLFLIALGYAIALPWLGWLCALLAALTAYIRTLGGTLGQTQDFRGPMAKPHRMWVMGGALVAAAALEPWRHGILLAAAAIIAIGSAMTCISRIHAIATRLPGAGT